MSETKALDLFVRQDMWDRERWMGHGTLDEAMARAATELAELKADMSAMATLGMNHQMEREQLRSDNALLRTQLDEAIEMLDLTNGWVEDMELVKDIDAFRGRMKKGE
jgi:hypothetical protein